MILFIEHAALVVFTFLGVMVTVKEAMYFVSAFREAFRSAKKREP